MKVSATIFVLAAIGSIISFSSCTDNSVNNRNALINNQNSNISEPTTPAKDTTENLKVIIKMPFEPEETVWREDAMSSRNSNNRKFSPDDKKLTSVLRFAGQDVGKITAQAETYRKSSPTEINTEDWFPAELIAQSELSGNETLKGNVYAPTDFIQPPYVDGDLIRIENSNYFILELYTK